MIFYLKLNDGITRYSILEKRFRVLLVIYSLINELFLTRILQKYCVEHDNASAKAYKEATMI